MAPTYLSPAGCAVLSTPVANGLAQEMRTKKTKRWSSLEQFVRNCRGIWEKVGCRHAKKYKEAADPRLAELWAHLKWFRDWRRAVYSRHTSAIFPRKARKKQFLSRETYFDLRLTITGFSEFCEFYLPTLPPGACLRASRLSQDPVGAAQPPRRPPPATPPLTADHGPPTQSGCSTCTAQREGRIRLLTRRACCKRRRGCTCNSPGRSGRMALG